MKYLINESQIKTLLTEDVEGVGSFLYKLGEKYPIVDQYYNFLKREIEKSGCSKIEFCKFSQPALGASFKEGVLINIESLNYPLSYCLFVIFHEIAHQYQYKKYGADYAIKCYHKNIPIKDAIKHIKNAERIADQYGMRKCREFAKIGIIKSGSVPTKGAYDNLSDDVFKNYVMQMRNTIKQSGLTSVDEISSMFYNWIKSLI